MSKDYFPYLKFLDISYNDFKIDTVKYFLKSLKNCKKFKAINFRSIISKKEQRNADY